MRLHRPVHPQHQPHHAHSFAKTDTYASSGQDFASAGDKHASAGAGFHGGGIPADGRYDPKSIGVAGAGFDSGGPVSGGSWNPLSNILNQTKDPISKIGKPPQSKPDQPQQGPQKSSDAGDTQMASVDDGGSGGAYADGGIVDPKAYVQWPQHLAGTPGGFAEGGEVNPDTFLGEQGGATSPSVADLVKHSKDVYDYTHSKMEAAFNAAQNGGADNQGLAQGGIPAPPGPAGAGVKPHATTGNAGRPNWTAPNPTETASEKNYTQNVSSRPATSPARGTAFPQAGPDGGQRGQEWYGKGASPYGAGQKKKAGVRTTEERGGKMQGV